MVYDGKDPSNRSSLGSTAPRDSDTDTDRLKPEARYRRTKGTYRTKQREAHSYCLYLVACPLQYMTVSTNLWHAVSLSQLIRLASHICCTVGTLVVPSKHMHSSPSLPIVATSDTQYTYLNPLTSKSILSTSSAPSKFSTSSPFRLLFLSLYKAMSMSVVIPLAATDTRMVILAAR